MSSKRIALMSGIAIILSATAATAWADQTTAQARAATDGTAISTSPAASIGEVIVTARQVKENIQRVPSAVTAVSEVQLRKNNIQSVMDLSVLAPSLTVASYYNDLNARFAVRGLSGGIVPLVTTYFSEAPCCGGVASAPFMDTSSVQVLSGPQGTLFGRSSAAGAVLITPRHPDMNDYNGFIDATVGTYDRLQFTGAVNLPIVADHLAARIAVNSNSVDGYTHLIGTSTKLDGVGNQQYRAEVEFKEGGFDNFLVGQYVNVDESGTGQVLASVDPAVASSYLISPAAGAAKFASVCTTAFNAGITPSLAACETQHTALFNQIGTALLNTPTNRARQQVATYDGTALRNQVHHGSLVDIAQYDFGDWGPLKVNVKNIFSYDSYAADASETSDGVGGRVLIGAFSNAADSLFGANNASGTQLTTNLGNPLISYTDEVQLHTNLNDGLLISTFGFYYQTQHVKPQTQGTYNVFKLMSGTGAANLGYQSVNFVLADLNNETAWYTQSTLDLSKVGIHGLSLTAGYRQSWDNTASTTQVNVTNVQTGALTPAGAISSTAYSASGYNYTFSAAEQINPTLMVYASVNRAYIPGGINGGSGTAVATLPEYSHTYASETVLEEELGAKWDFRIGDAVGRIDVDLYNNDFSNIFETLSGVLGPITYRYNVNAAAATLRGFEAQGMIIPNSQFEFSFGFNYNDSYYNKWLSTDPYNIAVAGNPICDSSSPAGFCFLNLKNNPLPFAPAEQGHVTAIWYPPVDEAAGKVSLSATIYAQSREYFVNAATRELQLFPGALAADSQGAYATLNLRVDWENIRGSGWDAAVFANNVTDAVYATSKIDAVISSGYSAANYAPPAMFGIEVRKQFGQ
jgi:iron complex outermembrane recepter protein